MFVVTFYSFKGGVGRTTLATNIAVRLAEREQRVLLVDFDLEAPGLTYLSELQPPEGSDRPRGVAGYLVDSWEAHASADYRQYLYDLNGFSGRLAIMPAGAINSDRFAQDLDALHREEILNLSNPGPKAAAALTLLADLREQWTADFDYVLIDSRTGFSDIGGICTRVLPDLVVAVLSLNSQGVEGTAQVLGQIGTESLLGHPVKKLTAVSMVPIELELQSNAGLVAVSSALEVQQKEVHILPFYLPLLVKVQPFFDRGSPDGESASTNYSLLSPLSLAYHRVLEGISNENQSDVEFRLNRARHAATVGRDVESLRSLLQFLVDRADAIPPMRVSRVIREAATLLLTLDSRSRGGTTTSELAVRALRKAVVLHADAKTEALVTEHSYALRALADALSAPTHDSSLGTPRLLESLELYRQIGDVSAEARVLAELGWATYQGGDMAEAEQWYVEALELFQGLGDGTNQIQCLRQIGDIALRRGLLDMAYDWYKQALDVSKNFGDNYGQRATLVILGRTALDLRKFAESEYWYSELLNLAVRMANGREQISALRSLAFLAEEQDKLDEAVQWYRQALMVAERQDNENDQRIILEILGSLYEGIRQFEQAERCYEDALQITQRGENLRDQLISINRLGELAIKQGRLDVAEEWFYEALSINRHINDEHASGEILQKFARVAVARDNLHKAYDILGEAQAIFQRTNDRKRLAAVKRSRARLHSRIPIQRE